LDPDACPKGNIFGH